MNIRTILTTTGAFEDDNSFRSNLIKDLCKVSPDDWSPREKALMNNAAEHGETYHMTIEEKPNCRVYYTDLGDSDSMLHVSLPLGVPEDEAVAAVQLLAESLS